MYPLAQQMSGRGIQNDERLLTAMSFCTSFSIINSFWSAKRKKLIRKARALSSLEFCQSVAKCLISAFLCCLLHAIHFGVAIKPQELTAKNPKGRFRVINTFLFVLCHDVVSKFLWYTKLLLIKEHLKMMVRLKNNETFGKDHDILSHFSGFSKITLKEGKS